MVKVACLLTVSLKDTLFVITRVTVEYFDKNGEKHRIKLKGVTTQSLSNTKSTTQTVSCSTTASMKKIPFAIKDGMLIVE